MIRLLTDENFDYLIQEGILARIPTLDLIRVHDIGLLQTPDPIILEWAARNNRILLTHDVQTLVNDAYNRVRAGLPHAWRYHDQAQVAYWSSY